ncbi:FAD/NAD(P)-binding protein [Streptomyces sp. NPDC049590]|uniref:FAD/NAD(P)-binding protein n=1 Tax=Streptomyces sp. NPDC049590 TaxID=3154834 RepID=UPI0034148FAF
MTVRRIAVVGCGPRGLEVVERLAARLSADSRRTATELYLIDAVEVGPGRIYRTDQPDWFLMNTVAGELCAFSGPPDQGPPRAGAGPSFLEWWQTVDPSCPGPDDYAPRARYGGYLRYVLDCVQAGLPPEVTVHRVRARVDDLAPAGPGYRLALADGTRLTADRVVLTTGHSVHAPAGRDLRLAAFAADRPALRHLAGDSAADLPLAAVEPGSPVGIIGLGLSFYDVLAALTEGRGGRFVPAGGDRLRYLPSGAEPLIAAGSRSGVPLPARGRNQKPRNLVRAPLLFTAERVRGTAAGPLDFRRDVLPWLLAEMDVVYYGTALAARHGPRARDRFVAEVVAAADGTAPDVPRIAAGHRAGDLPRLDLDALARPFTGRRFASPAQYEAALRAWLREDLREASAGNVDSPLKAALDVLRDCRSVIRALVDFSGLTPRSHRDDFLGWYVPRAGFLSAGPPAARVRQALALMECGVLRVVGPGTEFRGDEATGRFVLESAAVAGSRVEADTLVDARIPVPDLRTDRSPLTRALRARGLWTSYVNGAGDDRFDTGGVAVGHSPYHPVGRDGSPDRGLYVLGIPTEHTRWFMQGASGRPGAWSYLMRDADGIAADLLATPAGTPAPAGRPRARRPVARRRAARPAPLPPARRHTS